MNILLTGDAGFIGSNLLKKLCEASVCFFVIFLVLFLGIPLKMYSCSNQVYNFDSSHVSEGYLNDVLNVDFENRITFSEERLKNPTVANQNKNSIIYKIPTDYTDLQTAIIQLETSEVKQGTEIILLIESGHKLTKGLKIVNGDYSRFRIKSEDDVVYLDRSFVGYNATDDEHQTIDGTDNTLFVGVNCTFPTIDALFDMENKFGDGVAVYRSNLYMDGGSGVKNAGRYGCYAKDASNVMAVRTIWDGSNSAGVRLQHATCGHFGQSSFIGCHKLDDGLGAVYVSKQCICQVRESVISDVPFGYALLVRRSRVDVEKTTINNCAGGIRAEGASVVSVAGTMIDGITKQTSVSAIGGSIIGGEVQCRNSSHPYSEYSVASGGMILGAAHSSLMEDEEVGLHLHSCKGITAFNVFSEGGIICPKKSLPTYKRIKLSDSDKNKSYIINYPSHSVLSCQYIISKTLVENRLLIVDLDELGIIPDGYVINSINITGSGNTDVNGLGDIIMTNISHNNKKIYIYNTGIHEKYNEDNSLYSCKSITLNIQATLLPLTNK